MPKTDFIAIFKLTLFCTIKDWLRIWVQTSDNVKLHKIGKYKYKALGEFVLIDMK